MRALALCLVTGWLLALSITQHEIQFRRLIGETGVEDSPTLSEMLGGLQAQRWAGAPRLKILASVMDYRAGQGVSYAATSEVITESEIAELEADLTSALRALTADTFDRFASIEKEVPTPGSRVSISRPGFIIVGRFDGLREVEKTVGFGGRKATMDGTITAGAMILDNEFDRGAKRRLLRTHELGHALGYSHVRSRPSIMNPRIGSDMTELDRKAAVLAFRGPALVASR